MTLVDLWIMMPFLIIGAGSLAVLIGGAFLPGRYLTGVGTAAALAAAWWALRTPPLPLAPFLGIAATPFARFFTVLFCLTAAAALLLSHSYNRRRNIIGEEYPATILFAALGMTVLAASVNLLTLFLGLEALTFAFYILTAFDRERPESSEAGMKYLLMGATAAAFIAFGMALIYAGTGTLELTAAMRPAFVPGGPAPLVAAGWGFLLVGIAFKVSLVPAHLWTPDVYQGSPPPVTAFLSTGSKAAAFAALLLLVPASATGASFLHAPLWVLSFLSMTVGNLAALRQRNLKRMFAYSSIAHMGYVALALTAGSGAGYVAVVLYLVAYTVTNLSAFGAIASLSGDAPLENIDDFRGIGKSRPFRGGMIALALFSLAGIPPTVGFMGKFAVFAAALRGGETVLAVIGILTAVVSVYYYMRVVVVLYSSETEPAASLPRLALPETVALAVTGLSILLLGLFPNRLLLLIEQIM